MNQTFCPSCRHTDELLIINSERLSHCLQCGLQAPATFFTAEPDLQSRGRIMSDPAVERYLTERCDPRFDELVATHTRGRIVKLLACAPGSLEDWAFLVYDFQQTRQTVQDRSEVFGLFGKSLYRWVFVNNKDPNLAAVFELTGYPSSKYIMTVMPINLYYQQQHE